MELSVNKLENITIIEIKGKFDIESTEDFENKFNEIIQKKILTIAIDMNKLEYIDSSGIGCLIKSLNNLKAQKGTLVLFGLKQMILNVFKLAKLDLFFILLSNSDFQLRYMKEDDQEIDELLKKNPR